MKKIFIDAGHGGGDPGAVGNGMRESDIVLDVALRLGAILAADFEIRQSRTTNRALTINERWQAANAWGADCLISIHANAGGGTGVETVIPTASPNNPSRNLQNNRRFAEIVSNTIGGAFNMRVRRANGVMLETETRHKTLGVLRHTRMIAIMPEIAFIDSPLSNPDVEVLRNRRADVAAALAESVYSFFGVAPSVPAPPSEQPGIIFRVQVGAFNQRANAVSTNERLRTRGFEGFIFEDGALFRVQVGAFRERSNAERLADTLRAQGFDTFITTFGG